MEEDDIEFRDDSSFEILHSSDEDDYLTNSCLSSSMLPEHIYDIMTDSFTSQPKIEEVEDNFESEYDILPARSPISKITNLPPQLQSQTQDSVTDGNTTPRNKEVENVFSGDNIPYGSNVESSYIHSGADFFITLPSSEMISPTLDTISGTATCQYHPNKIKMSEILTIKNCFDHQPTSDGDTVVKNLSTETETQRPLFYGPENSQSFQQLEDTGDNLALMRRAGNEVMQMNPSRRKCVLKLCPMIQSGLKLYEWISNHQRLRNLVTEAKSSFCNFLNMLEGDLNSRLGNTEDRVTILIIADDSDSKAIAEAFSSSLNGHVEISKCQVEDTSAVPVLPIGHHEAYQALQFKMDKARRQHDPDEKKTMICAVRFIAEIFCQRWQMGTILGLADPHLQLHLHNFTSTVPLPNEYIYQAEKLTPEYYPLREKGFALTFEAAIRYSTQTETDDVQEFLSGINHSKSLKSAAEVLAGMYKKYCKRFD